MRPERVRTRRDLLKIGHSQRLLEDITCDRRWVQGNAMVVDISFGHGYRRYSGDGAVGIWY